MIKDAVCSRIEQDQRNVEITRMDRNEASRAEQVAGLQRMSALETYVALLKRLGVRRIAPFLLPLG